MEIDLFKKIKKVKGLGFVILALAAGVILLLIPTGETKETESGKFSYHSSDTYISSLETKASSLIKTVSGVKDCTVMVTLESGYEYYYASDQRIIDSETGKDVQKEYVIVNVDGNQQPVLIEERMPCVLGVAVVCPGITAETEQKIISLLTALFDIGSNRINVTR